MTNLQFKALIGQILGDGHLIKSSPTSNASLRLSFGSKMENYAIWILHFFSFFKTSISHSKATAIKNGPLFDCWKVRTLVHPILTSLHAIFYTMENGKWVKIVPVEIITWMCPIVLAHLIIGDGSYHPSGYLRICTNAFTLEGCNLIATSITQNLGIECRVIPYQISKKTGIQQYIIVVPVSQMNKVRELVSPYMCPSMLYRIGIGEAKAKA